MSASTVFVVDEKHAKGGYVCPVSKVPKGAKTKPTKDHLNALIKAENEAKQPPKPPKE